MNLPQTQSAVHFSIPPIPRLSQSPKHSQGTTSGPASRTQSPRYGPRNNMALHALLNEESIPASPPAQPDDIKDELFLRQQPVCARSCGFGDRDRRAIDPPPIIQLKVHGSGVSPVELRLKEKNHLYVVFCSIWSEDGKKEMSSMPDEYMRQKRLTGNVAASPFVGIDEHGDQGSFFCFPDISCRTPGKYRLKFSLFLVDHRPGRKSPVKFEVLSEVFQCFSAKEFPGMSESTALAKALKTQGCNIPTKKGNEKGGGKRNESDEFSDEGESCRRKRIRSNQ